MTPARLKTLRSYPATYPGIEGRWQEVIDALEDQHKEIERLKSEPIGCHACTHVLCEYGCTLCEVE